METVFKTGDRVYEGVVIKSWGTVIETNMIRQFPIVVLFDDGSTESFTLDGRYQFYGNPTLSFTEYDLAKAGFSQERPEILPEKGDIVWVRDSEDEAWKIVHFIQKIQKSTQHYFECSNYSNLTEIFYYKFMTTKNPYKNESN